MLRHVVPCSPFGKLATFPTLCPLFTLLISLLQISPFLHIPPFLQFSPHWMKVEKCGNAAAAAPAAAAATAAAPAEEAEAVGPLQ